MAREVPFDRDDRQQAHLRPRGRDGIVVKDKRMAVDILLIRRDIRNSIMTLPWVDTKQMIADPLTKVTADPSFLRFIMKCGEYIVVKEDGSLEWRPHEQESRREAREGVQWIKRGCEKAKAASASTEP